MAGMLLARLLETLLVRRMRHQPLRPRPFKQKVDYWASQGIAHSRRMPCAGMTQTGRAMTHRDITHGLHEISWQPEGFLGTAPWWSSLSDCSGLWS